MLKIKFPFLSFVNGNSSVETGASAPQPMPLLWVSYGVVVLGFILMVMLSGDGIRGSDQLWYTREIETIISGNPKISNEVYPYPYLQNQCVDNAFIHHTLCHYLFAAGGKLLGLVRGWQVMNLLAMIVSGMCIAATVYHFTKNHAGTLAAFILFLWNPLTVWQGLNLLMESYYGMFMALLVFQFSTADKDLSRWLLAFVTLVFAVQCWLIFLAFILVFPLAFLFYMKRPIHLREVIIAIGFFFSGCLAILVAKLLFNNSLPPTLSDTIRMTGPCGLMEYYFILNPHPLDLNLLTSKFLWAMKNQFLCTDPRTALMFCFYNFMAIGSVALLLTSLRNPQARNEKRLALLACFAFVIHLTFISLHHAQIRVCSTFLVPQVACMAVFLTNSLKLRKRVLKPALASFLLLCVVFLSMDILCVFKVRKDALLFKQQVQSLNANFAMIPAKDRIIVEMHGLTYQPITYIMHPRKTLVLSLQHIYSPATYETLENMFQARWLICMPESSLPDLLHAKKVPLKTSFPAEMADLCLYQLPSSSNAGSPRP